MNIFYVHESASRSAAMLHDKHVVKMCLETAQLLCTAHWALGGIAPYKMTHKNHPSAVWVRSGRKQYSWAYQHFAALCKEYTHRWDRVHLCETKCLDFLSLEPRRLKDIPFTEPPQCMDEKYKQDDTVSAYRAYYVGEKIEGANWTKTEKPKWILDLL